MKPIREMKTPLIVAVGVGLYTADSLPDTNWIHVLWGSGLVLFIHAVVLVIRNLLLKRSRDVEANTKRASTFIISATLFVGTLLVIWMLFSGSLIAGKWTSYLNASVIGGLSSVVHLLPIARFQKHV